MKHRNFIKNSILILLPISLGVGFLFGLAHGQKTVETLASSYTVRSIPTTINLNDCSEDEIRNYYINGGLTSSLAANQRQGNNLLKNLKPILKNNQKYLSYGSGATTAVWQAYEIVDRDWVKSPATAISGYNASTNTITGYVYGTSNSSVGTNPYIHALYVNRDVTNETRAWGNHNQDQRGINQEHVWAKSCGFEDKSKGVGARGDLMHLWAGNGKVNGTYHSNYYYGYVDKTKSPDNASSYAATLSGNYKGVSQTLGGSYTVFEPQDCDKGDIARAIFYMVARYNYLSGSDSDGIDAGNPNLELTNELNWSGPSSTSYTSSTTVKGQMGILQDLLEWNRLDPPDAWEIHRNNLLYRNFTNNRNPFIDFPEWAEYIWGKSVDGSYSSASTGSANPSSDVINIFSGGGAPTVSGVSISPSSATINLKGYTSLQLSATVSGTDNPSQAVTWTSANTNRATVNSSGVVTGLTTGNVYITATSVADTTKSATCLITIESRDVSVTSVSLNKNEVTIPKGSFETLVETVLPTTATNKNVIWNTSDSNIATVTGGVVHAISNGEATITVTTDDEDKTASCVVTVIDEPTGGSVSISNYATDNEWTNGEQYSEVQIDSVANATTGSSEGKTLSNTGKYYTNGNDWRFYQSEAATITISLEEGYELDNVIFTFSNANSGLLYDSLDRTVSSETAVNVSGSSAVFSISSSSGTSGQIRFTSMAVNYHKVKELVGITLDTSRVTLDFEVDDTFESNNLVVTALYADDSEDIVTTYEVSEPDMTTIGTKNVTVTYTEGQVEVSETYEIHVSVHVGLYTRRIVSNESSSYYQKGSIYLTGTNTSGSASCSGFVATQTKVSGSTNIPYTYNNIRISNGHRFDITPNSGYIIQSVLLVAGSTAYANAVGNQSLTNCKKHVDGSSVILTPVNGSSTVGFRNSSQSRINYIEVTFYPEGYSSQSLTWSEPSIDVFSGTVLSSTDISDWNITYTDGGSSTHPSYSDVAIKLDDDMLSIPHTWVSDDDGKTLSITYQGLTTTATSAVCITQTINSVSQETFTTSTSNLTFTEACGGSGTANDSKQWTVSSDGVESTFDSNYGKGIHYGTTKAEVTYISLTSSAFVSGNITKVEINASTASGVSATVSVKVGDNAFGGNPQSLTNSAVPSNPYTFNGKASADEIEVLITKPSSSTGALYCKSIVVTYETSNGSQVISNNASHKAAQRVAVKFANAFNEAMDTTSYCTTNMSGAWSTCSTAYNTFKSEAAALGSTEEAYSKDLIKYATAQYTNDNGEACIERMLRTYEVCVQKHGQTAFMSDLITLGRAPTIPTIFNNASDNAVLIIVIVSVISVSAVGGYLFLKSRRKEEC